MATSGKGGGLFLHGEWYWIGWRLQHGLEHLAAVAKLERWATGHGCVPKYLLVVAGLEEQVGTTVLEFGLDLNLCWPDSYLGSVGFGKCIWQKWLQLFWGTLSWRILGTPLVINNCGGILAFNCTLTNIWLTHFALHIFKNPFFKKKPF